MSGIFGLVHHDPIDKNLIHKMTVPYEKPVPHLFFPQQTAVLGVKEKPFCTGRQDEYGYSTDEKIQVIFSGEITNREEIINTRRDKFTKASGDAEIIACLFEDYGSDCIKKISGQFCMAVWIAKEKRLHLLLDRVGGINSLYYALINEGFVFSSKLHSILAIPGIKKEINLNSLVELFTTGYILPSDSLIKNIKKLRPGEEVIYENGQVHSHVLDRIEFRSNNTQDIDTNKFYNNLAKSVKDLSQEKESAFLLSGGIDSSVLVGLASQNLGRKVKTFTASFPGYDIDESKYAEIVAKTYGCESEIVELGGNCSLDDLPEIIWHLDEPFLDISVIPVYQLFKKIKQKTPIIISGDGPDHLFGRYYPLAAKRYIANKIGFFKTFFDKLPIAFMNKIGRVADCTLKDAYNEIFALPSWGMENVNNMMCLFSPEISKYSIEEQYFQDINGHKYRSFEEIFNTVSYIDFYIDGSFGVFTKIGKMAAAHGLMIREPYLERGVSDFISSLPVRYKVKGNGMELLLSRAKGKYLLKYELGPKILPSSIIRKRKGGFTPPLKEWLRKIIKDLPSDRFLCESILSNEYLNLNYLEKIFLEHANAVRDWSTVIFMILSFDLWMRLIIENSYTNFPGWTLKDVYG